MAEWLRLLIFSSLNCLSSDHCGFEPSSGHMWDKFCLRVVRWFFSGISHFHPTYRLTLLKMSEIILTGCTHSPSPTLKLFEYNTCIIYECVHVCTSYSCIPRFHLCWQILSYMPCPTRGIDKKWITHVNTLVLIGDHLTLALRHLEMTSWRHLRHQLSRWQT